MPIYAYRCGTCGHAQDVLQKISDPVLTVCPACGADAYAKQVTAAGFQLKGSGWYVTDFRGGKQPAKDAAKDGGDGAPAAAEATKDGVKDGAKDGAKEGGKDATPAPAAAADKPATPAVAAPAAAPATPKAGSGA